MLNINFCKKTLNNTRPSVVAGVISTSWKHSSTLLEYGGAIAIATLGFILGSSYSLPSNAQNLSPESTYLTNIETKTTQDWNFQSEDESISVKDEIKELEDYSISDSEIDIELTEEEPKWGNRGDVEDMSVEVEVYDY